jgi:acylphosphatase
MHKEKEINCRIFGRVQMVMFRDFVCRHARELGLFGTVRNLKDGSVSVVAQGEEISLKKLIDYLHQGPVLSRVDRVDVEWRQPRETFSDFRILY